MKSVILVVGALVGFGAALPAEEVTLFSCASAGLGKLHGHDAEKVTLGAELSKINTGSKTFRAVIEQYRETSWKAEPFYGPVKKFIVRDAAKKLYIVHFEYLKGHKLLDPGSRFAVAELQGVDGHPGEFIGAPYNGSSVTEKTILDQLQRVAATLKEPGKKP
ncbi:MAG TPA: hypothetical protein DIT13_09065 [Verrucomicrobiales bacterium]|nr:hypothetical protein [Verrucomicrobiales bacterium]HRK16839.1 hypothetical protein [Prosthecobacter sp.]